jgi:hypothetical protein
MEATASMRSQLFAYLFAITLLSTTNTSSTLHDRRNETAMSNYRGSDVISRPRDGT